MKSSRWAVVGVSLLVLAAVALPARADSIETYSFANTPLVGVGVSNTTASGSFSYDSGTHAITGATLTLNGGSFGNLTVNLGSPIGGNQYAYVFSTNVLNPQTGTMTSVTFTVFLNKSFQVIGVSGLVVDLKAGIGGIFGTDRFQVPEGGNWLGYLAPSSLVLLGALLLAGKQERALRR